MSEPRLHVVADFLVARPNEINSHVSKDYVGHWNLLEMLRELIANAKDEICKCANARGKTKKQIKVTVPGGNLGDFDFSTLNNEGYHSLGSIRWKGSALQGGTLTIENLGAIPIQSKMIGASSNHELTEEQKKEIVGRFGEGLKLALLTSLRLNKPIVIHTDGHIWTAHLRRAENYNDHVCMFFHTEVDPEAAKYAGKVVVEINNITKEEWIGTPENNTGVHSFLMLLEAVWDQHLPGSHARPIPAMNPERGAILSAPLFKGKLFNNGVYICTDPSFAFGYDLNKLTTNRDRGVIQNLNERRNATAFLIGDLLANAQQIMQHFAGTALTLETFVSKVYDQLQCNSEETWHLHCLPGPEQTRKSDVLFGTWQLKNPQPAGLAVMPVTAETCAIHLKTTLPEKGVSSSAYPMWGKCSWQLYSSLVQSSKFITIDHRIQELNLIPEHQLTAQQQVTHARLTQVLEIMAVGQGLRICYKVCPYAVNWIYNGCINLSYELLDIGSVKQNEQGILGNNPCVPTIVSVILNLKSSNLAVALSHLMLE